MKRRLIHIVICMIVAIGCGIAYMFWCRMTTLRIPCFFHELTGLYCSGCGVTRMCLALASLDFKTAFYSNRVVFIFMPVGFVLGIRLLIQYVKTGNTKLSLRQIRLVWVILITLVVFGILRNIPLFYFLRPIA